MFQKRLYLYHTSRQNAIVSPTASINTRLLPLPPPAAVHPSSPSLLIQPSVKRHLEFLNEIQSLVLPILPFLL